MTATGQAIREPEHRDWRGRTLSREEVWNFEARMPRCTQCGETVNHPGSPRVGQQTAEEIRALLGVCNVVVTWGGEIPASCWIEHHMPFAPYVRLVRMTLPKHGECLVETAYPDDLPSRNDSTYALGIFPIRAKEYVA